MSLQEEVEEFLKKNADHLLVAVMGYTCGVWLVPLTPEQFEDWWRAQPTFECWPENYAEEEILLANIFNEEPNLNKNTTPIEYPGPMLMAETDDDAKYVYDLGCDHEHYHCMLRFDLNSYLLTPDEKLIYHAGYIGDQ